MQESEEEAETGSDQKCVQMLVQFSPEGQLNCRTVPDSNQTRPNRASLSELLIGNTQSDSKANYLLSFLLVASLMASILNTVLLALVVKWLSLNDVSSLNGPKQFEYHRFVGKRTMR